MKAELPCDIFSQRAVTPSTGDDDAHPHDATALRTISTHWFNYYNYY